MKTKILTIIIVLLVAYAVMASPGPGRSIMSALSGIQDAILVSVEPEAEKEWYFDHFKVGQSHNDSLFVVPIGRQFVVRRIYAMPDWKLSLDWHLAADRSLLVDGSINLVGTGTGGHIYNFKHDFPDNCLTVDSEETLNAVNDGTGTLTMTIIGYFKNMP